MEVGHWEDLKNSNCFGWKGRVQFPVLGGRKTPTGICHLVFSWSKKNLYIYIYLAVTESSWKYTYALLNATPSYVRDSCIDIWSYIHMITYVYIYIRYLIDIPLYPSQNPLFSILFWCAEIILTYECPITVPQNTAKDIHAFQDQRFLVERSCSFLMFIHCLSLFFSQYQTSIRKVYKCNSGGGNKCKACQPHGTRQARGM